MFDPDKNECQLKESVLIPEAKVKIIDVPGTETIGNLNSGGTNKAIKFIKAVGKVHLFVLVLDSK